MNLLFVFFVVFMMVADVAFSTEDAISPTEDTISFTEVVASPMEDTTPSHEDVDKTVFVSRALLRVDIAGLFGWVGERLEPVVLFRVPYFYMAEDVEPRASLVTARSLPHFKMIDLNGKVVYLTSGKDLNLRVPLANLGIWEKGRGQNSAFQIWAIPEWTLCKFQELYDWKKSEENGWSFYIERTYSKEAIDPLEGEVAVDGNPYTGPVYNYTSCPPRE